jgi:5-methylcytosine-specific restriction endonuclease McrA
MANASHMPWWKRIRYKRKAKADLRKRHGDDCWRCSSPMRFHGLPNRGKAATIEHLTPLAKGGGWDLENLRLCHVGCNRHLGARTRVQKERMRIGRMKGAATGHCALAD